MDTVGSSVSGYLPILEDCRPRTDDGVRRHAPLHAVVAVPAAEGRQDAVRRGYHIEIGGGRGMPGAGIFGGSHTLSAVATARISSAIFARPTAPTSTSPAAAR